MSQMYMFFGSSVSNQFAGITHGVFCHYVFHGATIKGLARNKSKVGHSSVIKHALRGPSKKSAFFMLGTVDLDFSLIRHACIDHEFLKEEFLDSRIKIYSKFIRSLDGYWPNSRAPENIYILSPQISPMRGENLFTLASKQIKVPHDEIQRACLRYELSDANRAKTVLTFNDRLQSEIESSTRAKTLRIDRSMIDENFLIKDCFVPSDPNDHHAVASETLALWRNEIDPYVAEHPEQTAIRWNHMIA